MTWAKLDDKYHSHHKVLAAGNAAVGLHARLVSWVADHCSDGHVPCAVAEHYDDDNGAQVARLLEVGLLEKCDGGYELHDYLDYNPTAKHVASVRKKRAIAGSKGGSKRQANCLSVASPVLGSCLVSSQAKLNPVPVPVPDPRSEGESAARSAPAAPTTSQAEPARARKRKAPETPLPADWQPTAEHKAWARAHNLDCDLEAQKFRSKSLEKDRRAVRWDQAFQNWLINALQYQTERNCGRVSREAHEVVKQQALPTLRQVAERAIAERDVPPPLSQAEVVAMASAAVGAARRQAS